MTGDGGMADRIFGARYDGLSKIVSGCLVAFLIAVPMMAMRFGAVAVFAALASAAVIGFSFAFSPRGYEISSGEFRVKRPIGDVVFPVDTLQFVRDGTAADFWGSVRLWGSTGLFGYYGCFWSKALGWSKWYVTDRNKAVVVSTGDKVILVSPEDRDGFVTAIRRADSATPGKDAPTTVAARPSPGVGVAIAGITLTFVAGAMLYSPGRPEVDLTRESLIIHSWFYGMTLPASSVEVAKVRVVDLQAEPGWKPVLRTGGFANPFYRAGNFRTANGRTVKLFTTGTQKLVLLPPSLKDGTPVLLDTAEPDQFAAKVREVWTPR
jgi:hypothetical protein